MTTSVIVPVTVTDAVLYSTSVPETDFAAWNAATSYTVGTKVTRAVSGVHKNFQNLIAGVDATLPEVAALQASPRWLDIGATNAWAMFDQKVGTVTTVASPLTVVLKPATGIGGLSLMGLIGKTANVTLKSATGGTTVYSESISLDGTIITSFFDWFFEDYVQKTELALTDLPAQYTSPELTVQITSTAGNVGVGVLAVGKVVDIGNAVYGAKLGIVDFSRKDVDAFGNYVLTKRAYSKRMTLSLLTDKSDFSRIFRAMAGIRATPAVFIATEKVGYESLIVYGFYKDFNIEVSYPQHHMCSLEIEGLI